MSWFGASSTLVTADEAWRAGVSALWYVAVPAVLTLGVIYVLAVKGRSAAAATLPGLLESRYGRGARIAAAGLIVWYLTLLAASQAMAARFLLSALFPGSGMLGFGLAVAVVLAYSLVGGLPAIVRAHALQFGVLAAALAAALVFLLGSGSPGAAAPAAERIGREGFFDVFRTGGHGILAALSFTLAWTVSPVAWQRIRAARSTVAARRAALGAAGLLAGLYAAVIAIGMLLAVRFPGSGDGNAGFDPFHRLGKPADPGGLSVCRHPGRHPVHLGRGGQRRRPGPGRQPSREAIQFPERKTAEKTGDMYPRYMSPVFLSRAAGAAIALASLLIALRLQGILQTLGLSSLVMAQGLFVPAAGALLLKKKSPLAGWLSLALGGAAAFLSFLVEAGLARLPLPVWPYSLPFGLGLSLAGFFAGLGLTRLRRN